MKPDFEAMIAWVSTYNPAAKNKAYSNKNEKYSVSRTCIVSIIYIENKI